MAFDDFLKLVKKYIGVFSTTADLFTFTEEILNSKLFSAVTKEKFEIGNEMIGLLHFIMYVTILKS